MAVALIDVAQPQDRIHPVLGVEYQCIEPALRAPDFLRREWAHIARGQPLASNGSAGELIGAGFLL